MHSIFNTFRGFLCLLLLLMAHAGNANADSTPPPLPDGWLVLSPEAQQAVLNRLIPDAAGHTERYAGRSCAGFEGTSVVFGITICTCPAWAGIPFSNPTWQCSRF